MGAAGKPHAAPAPKAYWVGSSEVHDIAGLKRYRQLNRDVLASYGAKFIVLHGRTRMAEGESYPVQTIVEFPSYEAAIAAYDDPRYQAAAKFRHEASTGRMVIVEGYAGPQTF